MPNKIDMIYDLVLEQRDDTKDLTKAMTNQKLAANDLGNKVENHIKDKTIHFNQGIVDETLPQRLKRKKPEILAGGGIGSAIGFMIWLLDKFEVLR